MSKDAAYRHYLRDMVALLRERATEAKATRRESEFKAGRALAYYGVLSTLKEEAVIFGLDLSEISFDSFEPDRDLL